MVKKFDFDLATFIVDYLVNRLDSLENVNFPLTTSIAFRGFKSYLLSKFNRKQLFEMKEYILKCSNDELLFFIDDLFYVYERVV